MPVSILNVTRLQYLNLYDLGYVHGTKDSQQGHSPSSSADDDYTPHGKAASDSHSKQRSEDTIGPTPPFHQWSDSQKHTAEVSQGGHDPRASASHSTESSSQHTTLASQSGHAPTYSSDGDKHSKELSSYHKKEESENHSTEMSQSGHHPSNSEDFRCKADQECGPY